MRFGFWAARAAALALVLGGIMLAGSGANAPRVSRADAAFLQRGLATWYGPGFEGSTTACGQVYHAREYTAASNTLPCGAVVTITSLESGDAVTVTITDRGAFTDPIVIDLSAAAFSAIADPARGVVSVAVAE